LAEDQIDLDLNGTKESIPPLQGCFESNLLLMLRINYRSITIINYRDSLISEMKNASKAIANSL